MKALCAAFVDCREQRLAPDLLLIASFVFDFLCIHPFRDGNGRVARLLTTLLLEQSGFVVARYVSLERIIEERRGEYYDALGACSRGWHEGTNPIAPWWNYLLGVIRAAYKKLETEIEHISQRSSKTDLVRQTIAAQVGWFTLADLKSRLPTVSDALLKKVLAKMKASREARTEGRGRSARWLIAGRGA